MFITFQIHFSYKHYSKFTVPKMVHNFHINIFIKINKVICFLHKCFSLGKSYISLTNNFSVDIILLDNEVVL